MNDTILSFASQTIKLEDVKDKDVLDIGSLNVNGTLKTGFMNHKANSYHGIDVVDGKGVDEVISIKDFAKKTNKKFDYIVCTDMIEHSEHWWDFFEAIPKLAKDKARVFFTVPGRGYPFHPYEGDFWRFSIEDTRTLFRCLSNCEDNFDADNAIIQTNGGMAQLVNMRFHKDMYEKRKKIYRVLTSNLEIYNILIGRRVSKKEWLEIWN